MKKEIIIAIAFLGAISVLGMLGSIGLSIAGRPIPDVISHLSSSSVSAIAALLVGLKY